MADLSARRVAAIAAVAAALVGGAVAAGVAMVASAGGQTRTASASAAGGLATAAVVRTTLTNAVQVSGSIGYAGAYTISTPSGSSAQDILQAQQTVREDRQTLSADEQTASDASTADERTITTDQAGLTSASATLRADRAAKARDCAGKKKSTPACTQAAQKAAQDQTPLTQARAAAGWRPGDSHPRSRPEPGKLGADQTKLRADRATLSSLEATAVNSGTTFTWLPDVGAIIRQDRTVYSVANEPVPLLYGSIAAYRAFFRRHVERRRCR